MAGIGFKLRENFEYDTYIDNLRGVIYAASVSGGPVFFSILCLVLLGFFSPSLLTGGETQLFLVTIVYVFAFSLISTGILSLLVTRYLSDLIYINRFSLVLPTMTSVLALTVMLQFFIGLPFLLLLSINWSYKITALILFIVTGCIWQLMIFLTSIKNYRIVFTAFLAGALFSFSLAHILGSSYRLTGYLHGYTIGQIVLMFILLGYIFVEFQSEEKPDLNFLKYGKLMPQLIFTGLFYNLGVWSDNIIFWVSDRAQQINGFLYSYHDYDTAMFFAFVTALPAYTYFLVKTETDFYAHFRSFYHSILNREPLSHINQRKAGIGKAMRESFFGLVKLQGTVSLLCLLFSREIADLLNLPVMATLIFDKAILAAFLQMLLLMILLFMLYFDIRKQAALVAGIFMLTNLGFSAYSLTLDYIYFGYGYLFACLISVILAYFLLSRHIDELEYRTFVHQPVS